LGVLAGAPLATRLGFLARDSLLHLSSSRFRSLLGFLYALLYALLDPFDSLLDDALSAGRHWRKNERQGTNGGYHNLVSKSCCNHKTAPYLHTFRGISKNNGGTNGASVPSHDGGVRAGNYRQSAGKLRVRVRRCAVQAPGC